MEVGELEPQIIARGKEFFTSIRGEEPSLFNKARWTGKVMDWCMKNEDFKVQLFRFVDVYPYLTTSKLLTGHIGEYFGRKIRKFHRRLSGEQRRQAWAGR